MLLPYKEKEDPAIKDELSKEERHDLDLARKAESQQEVFEILKGRDSKNFQMALAKLGNRIVQETLLDYNGIDEEALVEICKNPMYTKYSLLRNPK